MLTLLEILVVILPAVIFFVVIEFLIVFLLINYPATGLLSLMTLLVSSPVLLERWFKFSSRWL